MTGPCLVVQRTLGGGHANTRIVQRVPCRRVVRTLTWPGMQSSTMNPARAHPAFLGSATLRRRSEVL